MAIVLLVIGAAIGHVMTMNHCRQTMGPWGGHGMKMCCSKGGMEHACCMEHKMRGEREVSGKEKGWLGQKDDISKCKPGCTCPMCSKKEAGCPMKGKKEGKPEKN